MEKVRNAALGSRTALALGNFDGLHRAHMKIIENCISISKERGIKSGVMLFSKHTLEVLGANVELLMKEKDKLCILQDAGLDFAYIKDIDSRFMHLSPKEFATMLKNDLNPEVLCVGYDYRFGYKAQGDINTLKELGRELGFDVVVTDEVMYQGVPIKSTRVREYVKSGDVELAEKLLGRRFALSGKVVEGYQNGRKIGVPTANLEVCDRMIMPCQGVYMGYTRVLGKTYKSVINIGDNPTFNGNKITVESHILDFDTDIYGQDITIEFAKRIRSCRKFESINELKNQIEQDIARTREELA